MDKKIKLLVISDDIRIQSGVGIQCSKLCKGLVKTGKYDVVELGGSLQQRSPASVMVDGVKVYPTYQYGNAQRFREVFSIEQPDIVICFSDPRFFEYLFFIDNEIRPHARLILYHTWDNGPFPDYNLPWYNACDYLVMISKFSYQLLTKQSLQCYCIPHGVNEKEFYPLNTAVRNEKRKELLKAAGITTPIEFIVMWNNRNIARKRPGDVIMSFDTFAKVHPNTALIMNTELITQDGADLRMIVEKQCTAQNIILNFDKLPTVRMNELYNICDVTLNIAYSEGFGLSVTESLAAGVPVIATMTGGMTEQVRTFDGDAGILLEPVVKNLFGTPAVPYHYYDYVSQEQVVNALNTAYDAVLHKPLYWKKLGEKGREHVMSEYSEEKTIHKWDEFLQYTMSTPITFTRFRKVAI